MTPLIAVDLIVFLVILLAWLLLPASAQPTREIAEQAQQSAGGNLLPGDAGAGA